MKSSGPQKSQFPNSLLNWKKMKVQPRLIFNFPAIYELGKIEKSRERNIQKPQNIFVNLERFRSTA